MANEGQIERWNGATAERWLAERNRHAEVREVRAAMAAELAARVRDGGVWVEAAAYLTTALKSA